MSNIDFHSIENPLNTPKVNSDPTLNQSTIIPSTINEDNSNRTNILFLGCSQSGYLKEGQSIPWWLLPNLLALDAPIVAVCWQRFLYANLGQSLNVPASVTLGLVVWGLYLLDRGLDNRKTQNTSLPDRHRFAQRYNRLFMGVGLTGMLLGVLTAFVYLPALSLLSGTILGVLLLLYLIIVHYAPFRLSGSKEFLVGIMFAAGVAIPLFTHFPDQMSIWFPVVVGFAFLCWLNCLLIDRWEKGSIGFGLFPMMISSIIAVIALLSPTPCNLVLFMADSFILLLHLLRNRLGVRFLRVAVDFVLIIPLGIEKIL